MKMTIADTRIKNLFLFFVILLSSPVIAENFRVDLVQIDNFICRNETNILNSYQIHPIISNTPLNLSTALLFDDAFKKYLNDPDLELDFDRGWTAERSPDEVFYFYLKNGDWYYIKATLPENVTLNELQKKKWYFERDLEFIKAALKKGVESATGLNCQTGPFSERKSALYIVNIYDFNISNLNCSSEAGSIFIDCSAEQFVNDFLLSLWIDLPYYDRRSYRSVNDYIFVDVDQFYFDQEDGIAVMNAPMLVISESDFSSNLNYGNGDYQSHVNYLMNLEKIPLLSDKIYSAAKEIANTTTQQYLKVEELKKIVRQNNKSNITEFIDQESPEYEKVQIYLQELNGFQIERDSREKALRDKHAYYSDLYSTHTASYLDRLDKNIVRFQKNLEELKTANAIYSSQIQIAKEDISDEWIQKIEKGGLIVAILAAIIAAISMSLSSRSIKTSERQFKEKIEREAEYNLGIQADLIYSILTQLTSIEKTINGHKKELGRKRPVVPSYDISWIGASFYLLHLRSELNGHSTEKLKKAIIKMSEKIDNINRLIYLAQLFDSLKNSNTHKNQHVSELKNKNLQGKTYKYHEDLIKFVKNVRIEAESLLKHIK